LICLIDNLLFYTQTRAIIRQQTELETFSFSYKIISVFGYNMGERVDLFIVMRVINIAEHRERLPIDILLYQKRHADHLSRRISIYK